MAKSNPVRIKVPARISFVKLAEPQPDMNNKGLEYSVECRVSKDDKATLKMIRDAMKKVVVEACGEKTDKWPFGFRAPKFFDDCLSQTGQDGIFLETVAQEVFDVSGAGDTVTAVFTAALAAGASYQAAGELANIAAGIVVSEVGTVPVSLERLRKDVERLAL